MTALLAVEVRRVVSRRLVRVSVALAVLAILAGAAIAFFVSRDMDQAALAQAEEARQAQVQQCITGQLDGVPAWARDEANRVLLERTLADPSLPGHAVAVSVAAEIARKEALGEQVQLYQFQPGEGLVVATAPAGTLEKVRLAV